MESIAKNTQLHPEASLENLGRADALINEVKEEMELLRRLLVSITDVELSAEEAMYQWEKIIQHRNDLRQKLNRDINLSVAIADYYTHTQNVLKNPVVMEHSRLAKLQTYASMDFLTGLYNRYFFQEVITKEIARASRHSTNFSLVLFDIDGFKSVNDTYGHQKGDKVLEKIATTIKTLLRAQDVPCRYGGDEFLCLLPDTNYFHALATTERMRRKIREIPDQLGLDLRLSITYGLSTYPWDGQVGDDLIKVCDDRLYASKTESTALRSKGKKDQRSFQRIKTPGNRGLLYREKSGVDIEVLDICADGLAFKSQQSLESGATYHIDLFLGPPLSQAQAEIEVLHLKDVANWFRIGGRLKEITFN
jgi:diguanylate cyclase (GGDEF)-like protein